MKTHKLMLMTVISITVCALMWSCGDDIEPIMEFHDGVGWVFLENGNMTEAATQFSADEMLQHLTQVAWERNYAFYYDKRKVGTRRDVPPFAEQNYFVFSPDGTAVMGDVNNAYALTPYTFTVADRVVTMKSASVSYTMKVVAIDDNMLVVDTPMAGTDVYGYDRATLVQRTVFKPYKPLAN